MDDSNDANAAAPAVSAAAVRAFRARASYLDRRISGPGAMAEVAGTCGLQDSPPGAAAVALHARVEGMTAGAYEAALDIERTLVRTWAMRGAPFVVPAVDLPVFTTGAMPTDEEGRTILVRGVQQALDLLGGGLDEYVAATRAALIDVLSGRRLEIHALGKEVAERIAPTLPQDVRAVWETEGPYAPGQPLGEGVVHFCIRILTLQRVLCFAPREGRTAPFVLLSEWLDPVPSMAAEDARRELANRYLHTYGPATAGGMASWLGVGPPDAAAWWALITADVVPVDVEGSRAWLLAEDVDALNAGLDTSISGVRLLPPGDPLLQLPDRHLLVQDRVQQQQLWPPLHAPGAVLVDGDVVGTWRGRKASGRLNITVHPFRRLASSSRAAIEQEAEALALLRRTKDAAIHFAD